MRHDRELILDMRVKVWDWELPDFSKFRTTFGADMSGSGFSKIDLGLLHRVTMGRRLMDDDVRRALREPRKVSFGGFGPHRARVHITRRVNTYKFQANDTHADLE